MIRALLLCLIVVCSLPLRALAGPPFDTDDPDPTEYRNYEIYSGLTTHVDGPTSITELPFLEVNYGLMPNVQFSVHIGDAIQTAADVAPAYGYEDSQMGVKVRFIQESEESPQVSLYPQVTFATGGTTVGQGRGTLFLPVWAQKTIGKVTVFGGGGYEFDKDATGPGDWQAGIAATTPVTRDDTIGMEFTRTTPHDAYQQSDIGFGMIHSLDAIHALLFSVGRSFTSQPHYRAYAAYGWFLGPKDSDKP